MNRRKRQKRQKLQDSQHQILVLRYLIGLDEVAQVAGFTFEDAIRAANTDAQWETPYMTLAQDRHEKRVFGHSVLDCDPKGCTLDKIEAAVAWNQPPKGWAGGGHEYHRRMNNRKKRR